jgi:hypothetical protein
MLITIIGVAVEHIDVKPTMSLKSIVTSSCVFASIDCPENSG